MSKIAQPVHVFSICTDSCHGHYCKSTQGMNTLQSVLTYEAIVALGVLDALLVLNHPAGGCY